MADDALKEYHHHNRASTSIEILSDGDETTQKVLVYHNTNKKETKQQTFENGNVNASSPVTIQLSTLDINANEDDVVSQTKKMSPDNICIDETKTGGGELPKPQD